MRATPEGLEVVLAALRERLVQACCDVPPRCVPRVSEVQRHEQDRVFRVSFHAAPGLTHGFYAKFYNSAPIGSMSARDCAQNEYHALELLQRRLIGVAPRITAPRPVLHFPKYACVVTEECAGTTLFRLMRLKANLLGTRSARAVASLEHAVRLYAEWLSVLQGVVRCRGQSYHVDELSGRFEQSLRFCLEQGYVRPATAEGLGRLARHCLEHMGACRHESVAAQMDAHPLNLLVTPQGICVFDFPNFGYGHQYHDIANFWWGLDIRRPLVDQAMVSRLRSLFLEEVRRRLSLDNVLLAFFLMSSVVEYARKIALRAQPVRAQSLLSNRLLALSYCRFLDRVATVAEEQVAAD